jgi:hypothetical protein
MLFFLHVICSFLHCSELSLNSHLLLQQLDSFEDVLNNLTEKYFDLCFGHFEFGNKVEEVEVCTILNYCVSIVLRNV